MSEKPQHDKCVTPGRPYLIGTSTDGKRAILIQPNCGLWTCPYCAEQRRQEWYLNALKGVHYLRGLGLDVVMLTLTSRGGKGRTRDRSLQAFEIGWPRLRKRARYAQGKLTYLAVPEQHKNGIIHWHLLANNCLSKRWWKDNAYYVGLGFMAEVSDLEDPVQGAAYVAKYLTKSIQTERWPKGFRRVRTSQDWPKIQLPAATSHDWQVFLDYGEAMFEVYMLRDYGVEVTIKCDAPEG